MGTANVGSACSMKLVVEVKICNNTKKLLKYCSLKLVEVKIGNKTWKWYLTT